MKRGRGIIGISACVLLLCLVTNTLVSAQSHEVKWGHISKNNLQMKVYSKDSSAVAVVLFDVGKITHDRKLDFFLDRHVRIKILTDQGFDWATVNVPFSPHDRQEVRRIDGATYYLDANGKMQKAELDHKDIFKEKVDKDVQAIKFTLPKVKPGAIIEYKYRKKIGDVWNIDSWTFQKDIPVVWSELDLYKPNVYDFKLMMRGSQSITEQSNKSYSQIIDLNELDRYSAVGPTEAYRLDGTIYHWALRDIPALEDESHVYARDFYRSRMLMQYAGITVRDRNGNVVTHRDFLGTWQKVRDELLDNSYFGGRLKDQEQFKSVLAGILTDKMSALEKMKAIYHHVQSSMVWDKTDEIFCESKLKDVYEKKSGTSAEINFLLIQMLRDAGINAYPMIASTRDHGPILSVIPIIRQFNTTICMTVIDNEIYFLDATNPYRPFNQVPERLQGSQGLVIKVDPEPNQNKIHWLVIKEKPKNEHNVSITGDLSEDGMFSGTIGIRLNGYYGTEYRQEIDGAKSVNDFTKKELLDHFTDVKIDSLSVLFQKQNQLPLMINIKMKGMIKTLKNGDITYLNPTLLFRHDENPFTQKYRSLPIDFPFPSSSRYMLKVKLDSGLTVTSNPQNLVRKLPDGGLVAQYIVQKGDGGLTVFSGMNISRIQYPSRDYKDIKDFYGKVVQDENTKIVLKQAQQSDNQSKK